MSLLNSLVSDLGLSQTPDPYLDSQTGILRNLPGASTADQLAEIEVDLTVSRTIQLQTYNLVAPTRDLVELQALHKHIFQDIFDWAGEIRTIDMRRGRGKFFAPKAGIETNALHVFGALHEKEHLRELHRDVFVRELASFYDQLNTGGSALFQRELFPFSRGVTNFSPLLTQVACVHSEEKRHHGLTRPGGYGLEARSQSASV